MWWWWWYSTCYFNVLCSCQSCVGCIQKFHLVAVHTFLMCNQPATSSLHTRYVVQMRHHLPTQYRLPSACPDYNNVCLIFSACFDFLSFFTKSACRRHIHPCFIVSESIDDDDDGSSEESNNLNSPNLARVSSIWCTSFLGARIWANFLEILHFWAENFWFE